MRKIILASRSPRRKQLLQMLLGDSFEIKTSSYEENDILGLEPKDLVLRHSLEKGRDVAKQFNGAVVISADTIVVFENEILGKPHTREKAREMLKKISGNIVTVK